MMQYIAALIGRATICTSSWRQECVLLPCRGPASFNAAAATLQWRFKHFNDGLLLLTLLEPQSRYGDNRLKLQVVCPPNGTAVLKGLKAILNIMCARSLAPRVRFFVGEEMRRVTQTRWWLVLTLTACSCTNQLGLWAQSKRTWVVLVRSCTRPLTCNTSCFAFLRVFVWVCCG